LKLLTLEKTNYEHITLFITVIELSILRLRKEVPWVPLMKTLEYFPLLRVLFYILPAAVPLFPFSQATGLVARKYYIYVTKAVPVNRLANGRREIRRSAPEGEVQNL
jgi:hypothetical protein